MENRKQNFLSKILNLFEDAGFGIEKYSDDEYVVVDRSKIGKVDAGSIKIRKNGDVSIRLNGESANRRKFAREMSNTSLNCKLTHNVAQIGKMVKALIKDYKSASKSIYKESTMIRECTEQELENIIDQYLDMAMIHAQDAPVSLPDMEQFVADELGMTLDDVDAKFGCILSAALNNDEDQYIACMDQAFYETNLKKDFAEYWEANKNKKIMKESAESIMADLKADPSLKALRNTIAYQNGDLEYKYRKLWKFAVSEYGRNIADEDEIADVCMQLAEEDDNRI